MDTKKTLPPSDFDDKAREAYRESIRKDLRGILGVRFVRKRLYMLEQLGWTAHAGIIREVLETQKSN